MHTDVIVLITMTKPIHHTQHHSVGYPRSKDDFFDGGELDTKGISPSHGFECNVGLRLYIQPSGLRFILIIH